MPLFTPDHAFHRITDLTLAWLEAHGIKGMILDIDNTLTTHNNPAIDPAVVAWLAQKRQEGITFVLLSNNSRERVTPFAAQIDLPFVASGKKPLPSGMRRAVEVLGLPKEQIAVVGDQIFTDLLGGNLTGLRTVYVEPMELESGFFFRLKRKAEIPFIKRIKKREAKA